MPADESTAELSEARTILRRYPCLSPHVRLARWQGGGFSGAQIWQVGSKDIGAGEWTYCLRRWPAEHPTRPRLEFIHRVLRLSQRAGIHVVPTPIQDSTSESIIESNRRLWELTPWLPGEANYRHLPSRMKLESAMMTLAAFHVSVADFLPPQNNVSTGLEQRYHQAQLLRGRDLEHIASNIVDSRWPGLAQLAREFLEAARKTVSDIEARLRHASTIQVAQQPCIRDIWHDHLLFVGDQVSGIIDFGAMRIDTVAGDLGRCIGSLVGDDADERRAAISFYERVRPLTSTERELIDLFDESAILLGGINWLRWIYLEGRQFSNREAVESRFHEHLRRIRRML